MTKKLSSRVFTALIFFLALALFLLSAPLWAGGDHHTTGDTSVNVDVVGGDTSNNVNVDVGGVTTNVGGDTISMQGGDLTSGPVNVSTGGNKSLALGNVLGDVDIAGCLGSTQWSTPVYGKQKLSLNWVCVAEFYIRYGQPELAAMALCNTEIIKEFESEESCEEAHQFLAQAALPEPAAGPDHDDEEDYHEAQQTMNMMLQSEIEQLKELYERQPAPIQKTIIEQRPYLTDEQRVALQELKK